MNAGIVFSRVKSENYIQYQRVSFKGPTESLGEGEKVHKNYLLFTLLYRSYTLHFCFEVCLVTFSFSTGKRHLYVRKGPCINDVSLKFTYPQSYKT